MFSRLKSRSVPLPMVVKYRQIEVAAAVNCGSPVVPVSVMRALPLSLLLSRRSRLTTRRTTRRQTRNLTCKPTHQKFSFGIAVDRASRCTRATLAVTPMPIRRTLIFEPFAEVTRPSYINPGIPRAISRQLTN